jgi:hypothetical protein
MDHVNRFETPTTYRLHKAEYLVGLAVVTVLLLAHLDEIRWIPAVALFVYIDLIGYLPGAIAYRRSPDHTVAKGYYVLYNTMHSMITQTVVALLWIWLIGPEWALLVLPLHLFADRGIFGNFLKPFSLPFEPEPNAAFERFSEQTLTGAWPVPVHADATAVPAAGR